MTIKIYCSLCGNFITECESVKNNINICHNCFSSVKTTTKDDGSIHIVVYPYELAIKKRPELYIQG